jgi:hypothetical protein
MNHKTRKAQIYTKAPWCSTDSRLYTSWSSGVKWDHNGENNFHMCLYWKTPLKVFFSKTNGTISIKLVTNHPCIKGKSSLYKWRVRSSSKGDNCKNRVVPFKFFLKKHQAKKAQVYIEAFWYIANRILSKSWYSGVRWGHNWKSIFAEVYTKKKIFSKTSRLISVKRDANYPCMKGIRVCLDKGTNHHQRGDNHKTANIGWNHLKILYARTNDSEKLRFTWELPEIKPPYGSGLE